MKKNNILNIALLQNKGKVSAATFVIILAVVLAVIGTVLVWQWISKSYNKPSIHADRKISSNIVLSRPRQNILDNTPNEAGFYNFSIIIPNVISRSGQPTLSEFRWLKDHGWRGIVDLRYTDDAKMKGFNELGFHYLALPIYENSVPTQQQAQEFLKFVTDSGNQPVHIHCHAGMGRTGLMAALYRYMVQGWPMDKAIRESRLFDGGVNPLQESWLKNWANSHLQENVSPQ